MANIKEIISKIEEEKSFSIKREMGKNSVEQIQEFMDKLYHQLKEDNSPDLKKIMEKIDKRFKIEQSESMLDFVSVV